MKRIDKVMDILFWHYRFDYYKDETDEDPNNWYGIIEFWTDTAGQDILVEINFDGTAEDFVKEFVKHAKNYSVDDEVRGCCQEAKDTLMLIADRLQVAVGLKVDEKKYRIHANVTKEIEITQDQAKRLRNYINGCTEHAEIDDIKEMFGSNSGSYEGGYIPFEWLCDDLQIGIFENDDPCRCEDIEL